MSPADALLDLLERERRALTRADFDALARLADEKTRITAELPRAPRPDPECRARLRAAADRNARLLQGLRNGLAAAALHLADLRAGHPLRTYGSDGQRLALSGAPGAPIRRA
ncbi:hypothetical protein [Rhodovulum adriaticum]|uniref:FlgN protein n=1 Tax=Rhodovulum adriaticum TaxID=35804 RepID=A0A4R2P0T2_RHOAD|nr:hypothetical protein [Rhodovulum adriaticum]MBK1634757.1 hypothetical protein [Rhodovulum adriaticum]TCP27668.1 hypothetical protein EV656_101577 [Rhodovulum adriaticum]